MPSDGWPGPDEDAPFHGIVTAIIIGLVVWVLTFTLGMISWHLITGWVP